MAVLSQQGKQLSGREIHFLSRDELDYPQLTRLCLDFDFRVLGVSSESPQPETRYLISDKHYRDQDLSPITPLFDSLAELERYTNAHIIDILHDTLLEDSESEEP
jgi:hypothetical protein